MRIGKLLVFAGVAAAHAAVIWELRKASQQPQSTRSQEFYSTWILVEPPPMKERAVAPTPQQQIKSPDIKQQKFEPLPITSKPSPQPLAPEPSDWWQLGEQAATDSIHKDAARTTERSLMSKPKIVDLPSKGDPPRSIATSPKFKNGDSQRFDDGEVITWVSGRCYYTNRVSISMPSTKNSIEVCLLTPPIIGGDDLLADIKPKYLREPPKIPAEIQPSQ